MQRKLKTLIPPLLVLVFFFLSGCSPEIVSFTSPTSSFSSYGTYTIANFKVSRSDISSQGVQILDYIEAQIRHQMDRRDYQLVSGQPDLIVRYELISNQRSEQTQSSYSPYSYYTYTTVRTVLESALLIEITDLETKKIIWQASVDLNKYTKKNKQEEILQEAISQLYDTYLYRAKSGNADESLISDK